MWIGDRRRSALGLADGAGHRPLTDRLLVEPFAWFQSKSAAAAGVLFAATLLALVCANGPLHDAYEAVFHLPIMVGVGALRFESAFHGWIDDVLMSAFFLLVGLEIKRELMFGGLREWRRAMLPIVGAIGGMAVPGLLYTLVQLLAGATGWRGSQPQGWAIPTATDIAFALGVLALLGDRVPSALRVFLCTLAIVDDLGALVVIAAFYTDDLNWTMLGWSGLTFAMIVLTSRLRIREPMIYLLGGAVLLVCLAGSGVHSTLAGVLLATQVPVSARVDARSFLTTSRAALDEFERHTPHETDHGVELAFQKLTARQIAAARALTLSARHIRPPMQRIEWSLASWVSFLVLPLFALGNAGVRLAGESGHGAGAGAASGAGSDWLLPSTVGVFIGLLLGKPLGILLACWGAVRLRLGVLPDGVSWTKLAGVACLGGIGFTMAMFVTNLAFDPGTGEANGARLAILAASIASSAAGLVWLTLVCRPAVGQPDTGPSSGAGSAGEPPAEVGFPVHPVR